MTKSIAKSASETTASAARLLEIVTGSWMSQATYVAAELNIADLLADGPKMAGATPQKASEIHANR